MRIATALCHGSSSDVVKKGHAALASALGDDKPVLIMAFSSTKQPLPEVLAGLGELNPGALVLGCSTAGEFTEQGDAKGSTSLFAVSGDMKAFAGFATQLAANPEEAVQKAAAALPEKLEGYPYRTAIVLLDALAGVSEETTLLVADVLGIGARLAGGAAGDDLQMKAPLVGVGRQTGSDSLALAVLFTKTPIGVGVSHGHRPLSKPLKITKSKGAVVQQIEGRPAWDVWQENTAEAARARGMDPSKLTDETVGAYLLQFEAGLDSGALAGTKIRAPLARGKDGSLSFACGIPEGAVVRITESDAGSQIESARAAAKNARKQLGGSPVAGAVVFDCICRNLILGDKFGEAVRGIRDELGGVPIAGFESYGEVALDAGDLSGFHNTTTVVLAFGAR